VTCVTDRLDQLAADIGRLRRRHDRLRDAIEEYILWEPCKAGHAAAHHKLCAALHETPERDHIIDRIASHVEALALMLEPTAAQLAAWWAPGQEEAILEAIRIVDARSRRLRELLGEAA
jgi:hypothetical protein